MSCAEQRSVSNTGEHAHLYWVSKPGHKHNVMYRQTRCDVHIVVVTTEARVIVLHSYHVFSLSDLLH